IRSRYLGCLSRDEVGHRRWPITDVECESLFFGEAIAYGHTLMLAQVLGPRVDDKSFDVARRVSGVGIQIGTKSTVPETLLSYGLHGHGEILRLRRIDAVLDGNQYWPVFGTRLDQHCGLWPMSRRGQI